MRHKQNVSHELIVRDSIPLLFTPPRVIDRQIQNRKENEVFFQERFEESKDNLFAEHVSDSNESVRVEDSIKEIIHDDLDVRKPENTRKIDNKDIPHEGLSSEAQLLVEKNKPRPQVSDQIVGAIIDAESTVSAMKNLVEQEINTLIESPSFIENELSLNEIISDVIDEFANDSVAKKNGEQSAYLKFIPLVEDFPKAADDAQKKKDNEESLETTTKKTMNHKSESPEPDKFSNKEYSFDEDVSMHEETALRNNEWGDCSITALPMVKLPILLAVQEVEVDVLNGFDLPVPLKKIQKVEWKVQSLDVQVLLPATKAFLKGELTASIDYLQGDETHSLHNLKLNIPWNKVMEVHWLYPPDVSSIQQKEYMFKGEDPLHTQSHYESIQKFSDTLYYDLKQLSSVWHQDLLLQNQTRKVEFQGTFTLSIHLFQTQLINLNTEQHSRHYE